MLNLFRKDGDIVSICAIPDGGTLPAFLRGDGWSFAGKVADISEHIREVDRATFEAVLQTAGYYVFVGDIEARS